MDPRRAQRISEALREEIAEIIEYEMTDPRIGLVGISAVELTPDMRNAHVKVILPEDSLKRREALEALEHARHYLRRELSNRLRMYRVPEIHFEVDSGTGAAGRVEELLDRIRRSRAKSENSSEKKP